MPVKNAGNFIDATLYTIVKQTYNNWELIVVDDRSTDNSKAIIKKYQAKYQNIYLFSNNEKGIVNGLKTAYSKSTGEFIHRMDADDLMPERKLEWMINAWKPNAVVTGMVKYFSEEWMVGGGFKKYEDWINQLMMNENVWEDIYMECPIPSPAWLLHRADFEKIGAFRSEEIPEDYDLCFRMYKKKINPITIKKILHYWRDSKQRTSRNLLTYYPINYFPLKVKNFINQEVGKKRILLWGAGKKGKILAKLLQENNTDFWWYTNNPKKQGVTILNNVIKNKIPENLEDYKIIVSVSSPEDKKDLMVFFNKLSLKKGQHYFWFS
jgi:glycosyltransferase involved in cell wall biosynthesis